MKNKNFGRGWHLEDKKIPQLCSDNLTDEQMWVNNSTNINKQKLTLGNNLNLTFRSNN